MRFVKPAVWIVLAFLILGLPASSPAQVAVGISVHVGPPVLPVYVQPVIPAPGYIWTPGYWAYGPNGYYWVPGVWVEPPTVGLLWTPGYWGWAGGLYVWHGGYWGPHVGFYGGINYGFGYGGVGFAGGYWRGGAFYYNRAVANVGAGTTIVHNTYNTTVVNNNTTVNRTAFNGGPGGIQSRPTSAELAAAKENHVQPTSIQAQHQQAASSNHALLASVNHGQPAVAATSKPGVFKGAGVVSSRPASPTQASTNAAVNRNAASVNSQTTAHTTTQAQATPKTTQPTNGAPSNAAHPAVAQSQNQQHPQPQAKPQPQPQQHQAPQHQSGEQGKPHKP